MINTLSVMNLTQDSLSYFLKTDRYEEDITNQSIRKTVSINLETLITQIEHKSIFSKKLHFNFTCANLFQNINDPVLAGIMSSNETNYENLFYHLCNHFHILSLDTFKSVVKE